MKTVTHISILALFVAFIFSSCGSGCKEHNGDNLEPQALNISVYLDLSDRLIRELTPTQTYRDTSIINYLVKCFINRNIGPALLKKENQDKMKVLFYPTPNDSEISILAQGLSVDMEAMKVAERGDAIDNMQEIFQRNLGQIYEETLNNNNWVGCDIWDFFSSKKVDNLCVKAGARNIIVILTDGYIFAEDHKIKEGNAYSYILPQTLSVDGSSLIDRRNGDLAGKGIEVLMLEINPYQPAHRDKMTSILENWFHAMGIEKFVIAETDANLTNTQTIIKNFLEE